MSDRADSNGRDAALASDSEAVLRGAIEQLRGRTGAVYITQGADALIVEPPESLGVGGYAALATEGRALIDLCLADDRMAMVNAWIGAKQGSTAETRARLRSDPSQWLVMRSHNLLDSHGVMLTVVWPTDHPREDAANGDAILPNLSTAPRFCSRKQNEEGNVLAADEHYYAMFGYTPEEVIGKPTFPLVHPEDQARVIEGWVAAVATGRVQIFRVRFQCADGSWLWVDTTLHNFLTDERDPHILAECIDVSGEMATQDRLRDSEALLRKLIEEMPDGLLQLDHEREVVYHNARLLQVLGGPGAAGESWSRAAAQVASSEGATPYEPTLGTLLRPLTEDSCLAFEAAIKRSLKEAVSQDVEVEAISDGGEARLLLMKVRPLEREPGVVTGAIASVQDVTVSLRRRRELERRVTLDPLTGTLNRTSIMAAVANELERSSNTGVIYVDFDRFKAINDNLGHAAGDEVLLYITERLKAAIRDKDELGRLGGDEFVVLLREVSGAEVAMGAAQRISESIRGSHEFACGTIELSVSVGVACVDDRPVDAEELVARADGAMYRSKERRLGIPVLAT